MTGRSGGGAYSWWIAALDERVKAAVPVAGIRCRRRVRGGTLRLHVSGEFRPLGLCHDLELGGRALLISNDPTRRSDRGPCEDEKAVRPPWGGGQPRAPYHRGFRICVSMPFPGSTGFSKIKTRPRSLTNRRSNTSNPNNSRFSKASLRTRRPRAYTRASYPLPPCSPDSERPERVEKISGQGPDRTRRERFRGLAQE